MARAWSAWSMGLLMLCGVVSVAKGEVVGERIVVKGRVVDLEGKPVVGAMVVVPGVAAPEVGRPGRIEAWAAARGVSGEGGRFELSVEKKAVAAKWAGGWILDEETAGKDAQVVAWKAGYAVGWELCSKVKEDGGVEVMLGIDDAAVEGRLVDGAGEMARLGGVRVNVRGVSAEGKKGEEMAFERELGEEGNLKVREPLRLMGRNEVVTDGEGRFRIDGLGRGRWVLLEVAGPGVAFERMGVQVDGKKFEHQVKAGVSVEGMVKDVETGEGMGGVVVESAQFADLTHLEEADGLLRTVTDARGHYRLDGFPKPGRGMSARNAIAVVPSGEQAYFRRSMELSSIAGPDGVEQLDVRLHGGVWIRGKVTEKGTGKPVGGTVSYTTYIDNPATIGVEGFERRTEGPTVRGRLWNFVPVGLDGTFKLVAAEGKAIVGVHLFETGYRMDVGLEKIPALKFLPADELYQPQPFNVHAVREIEVGKDGGVCDLEVDKGVRVKLVGVDEKGVPVKGTLAVRGWAPEDSGAMLEEEAEEIEVVGLGAGEERTVVLISKETGIGGVGNVKGGAGEAKVEMRKLGVIEGLVTHEGRPLKGNRVEARLVDHSEWLIGEGASDGKGWFEMPVPAGMYHVPGVKEPVKVEVGKTVDVGEIKFDD